MMKKKSIIAPCTVIIWLKVSPTKRSASGRASWSRKSQAMTPETPKARKAVTV